MRETGGEEMATKTKTQVTVSRKDFKKQVIDDLDPDLSWLESTYDEDNQTIIKSMRYSNKDVKNLGWDEIKRYLDEDAERLAAYNRGEWGMVGIRASVELHLPTGNNGGYIIHRVTSPGLWGIESDSDESYFDEVFKGECGELESMLETLCVKVTK
jgi:hypothetical protein